MLFWYDFRYASHDLPLDDNTDIIALPMRVLATGTGKDTNQLSVTDVYDDSGGAGLGWWWGVGRVGAEVVVKGEAQALA